jgi:hypothetical protein
LPALRAQAVEFLPLSEVVAGARGIGKTVFAGDKVEEFDVEILGVLENIGPKQSLILGRLSGGPLAQTGVMAGMSGSPVYIDGKLAGAVAFAFPFTTEPIAGIRPIEEIVNTFTDQAGRPASNLLAGIVPLAGARGERLIPSSEASLAPSGSAAIGADPQLLPVDTPVSMAGFSERTIEVFGPKLRELGLRPMQGVGGRSRARDTDTKAPEPGSMISVGLVGGDFNLTAAGTVTHVDGDRLYAFGHRFLSSGPTEMPLMRSSVVALVPNLNNSFKIAGVGPVIGTISQDRSTGIAGVLGKAPKTLPLTIRMRSSRGGEYLYKLDVVNDRYLSPFLLQISLFSAVDATERQLGSSSFRVSGEVKFAGETPSLRLDNMFAGPALVSQQLSLATAVPLAYVMQSGLAGLDVAAIDVDIESIDEERSMTIDRVWASRTRVRPGETVELAAALRDENENEVIKKMPYRVPLSAPPGPLNITFSDGNTLNIMEWQTLGATRSAKDAAQLINAANRLRRNDRLFASIWRPEREFRLGSETLPSPPASLQAVLATSAGNDAGVTNDWRSTLEEIEIDGFMSVVEGSATMNLTITE